MSLTKEQQVCVDTLDQPVVVAAGAGSGKTFTLTERIANAFSTGYVSDIDEVCAITFTNKAAAELKSRIKSKLRAIRFGEQALKADEAWVSTIHGMCSRILKAHAIELGIDPAFAVVDAVQQKELLEQAVETVLAEARENELEPRLDALFREFGARAFGKGGNSVEKMLGMLVEQASAHAQGSDVFVLPSISAEPALAVGRAMGIVEGFLDEVREFKPGPKRDEWLASAEPVVEQARSALDQGVGDYLQALEVVGPMTLSAGFGGADYKARVKEARCELTGIVVEMRLGAARPYLELLVELAGRALGEYAALKRARGVVDNNDLLVLAAEAIESHPEIAARYTDKFKLVMIDEFQDTDQMQVDMIKRIAGDSSSRLCTVGDAQQSIYRFRGADVSVYRRHLESVRSREDGVVVQLSKNFRSHKDVLAFVDRVFEKPDMFGAEFMSLSADDKDDLAPFDGPEPRIIVQHTRYSDGCGGIGRAREEAARRIARQFAEYKRAGRSAHDMVILLGVMTNVDIYAQALRDEGLSCVLSGGSVFTGASEVKAVRALVGALANPQETQHVFDVLTSPLFSLTAGDILSVGKVRGFVRAASLAARGEGPCDPERSERLSCAMRVMGEAWASVGEVPLSQVVTRVVAASGWLSRLQSAHAEGLASAGNVFKAIRKIEEVEQAGALGPVSAALKFNELLDSTSDTPGALSVTDSDSVRIMTAHSSKGLEFPIVAIAEMRDVSGASGLVSASIAGKVYVALEGGATADGIAKPPAKAKAEAAAQLYDLPADEDGLAQAVVQEGEAFRRLFAIGQHSVVGEKEEAKRLLYVALTRAKEALVVSTVGKVSSGNSTGAPKNAFSGVFTALDGDGAGLGEGVTQCEFGGSKPARFECVELRPDEQDAAAGDAPAAAPAAAPDAGEAASGAGDAPAAAPAAGEAAPGAGDAAFFVPAADALARDLPCDTYKPAHEGVFSYSSISDASHEGDALARLAGSFAVSVDAPAEADAFCAEAEHPLSRAAFGEGDLGFDVSSAFDEDRATDLGTAFHRLAQYAVLQRRGREEPLAMPPAERVEALAHTCNLGPGQRERLDSALARWFGSHLARDMAALPDLAAEVPFFVAVEDGYLEGEIDLLGFDEARARAFVVDYKTGGSAVESADELRCKHVLQASCYAYAVLLQGAQSVDAAFVRVERPRADDPAEPQCVRYRFEASDLPALEQAICDQWMNIASPNEKKR